jgi:cell wall-associated NlpC family hydrolase
MKRKEKLKRRLVYFAQKHLGKPYKYGAKPWEAPKTFDCSSFVQYLYKRINVNLPRTALEQAHLGKKVNPEKGLEIGDLIFVKGGWGHYDPQFPEGIGHVAIYIGDGKIIHAKYEKNKNGSDDGKVKEDPVKAMLNRKDLIVIKRIL